MMFSNLDGTDEPTPPAEPTEEPAPTTPAVE